MATNKEIKDSAVLLLKGMSIPFVLYCIFFAIRVKGFQPPAEAELGEFITAIYFIFGASVSYVIFVLHGMKRLPPSPKEAVWWWVLSCFFFLLAFDEIYMIHENLSGYLNIREVLVFMAYGGILCVLVFLVRNKITMVFLFFFLGFVLLSGLSVIVDTLFSEGLVVVFGKEIDYEQLAESMAALSLASGFLAMAIQELRSLKWDT